MEEQTTMPEQPLREFIPLVENLVSVLLTQDYKSAELTALLIWMNSHCNACGRVLTAENQPRREEHFCATCA
jgi:formamidopyrimidine-DNA glycosylase